MSMGKTVLTGRFFMTGDEACAEGAIAAGCRFFGGYPITPATEIAERMALRQPQIGGVYIQMEDELASMAAILGASWAGKKAMTATSGPGFSLMMENFGLGLITETPCVLVNIQRGGPSTGLPTLVAQGDMMQARWGSHGDYEVIALCPSSPQEAFDFTIDAFNEAERYRLPVLVMADEVVGHMSERVVIPEADAIERVERKAPTEPPGLDYLPFEPDEDLVPPMATAGMGYNVHVTGLTHDERGYPVIDAETQDRLVRRLCDKVRTNRDKIIRTQEYELDDAEICLVAYGITSRVAQRAVQLARNEGIKAGLLRLVTAWPFAERAVRALSERMDAFIMPEINYGQLVYELERIVCGNAPVSLVPHMGGSLHTPKEILEEIRRQDRGRQNPKSMVKTAHSDE